MDWYDLSMVRVGKDFKVDFNIQGGHQVGLEGTLGSTLGSLKSSDGLTGRLSMSQEWSGLVSAEVNEGYMALQDRLQDYSLPHHSKVKSN